MIGKIILNLLDGKLMKTFRRIVTVLLIIPLAMILFWVILDQWPSFVNDEWSRDMLWLLVGLPILMVNYYAWIEPHIIDEIIAVYKKDLPQKSK